MKIDPSGGYGYDDIDIIKVYIRVGIKGKNTPNMLDILTGIRGIEDVITARQLGNLKKAPDNKNMAEIQIGTIFRRQEELKELEKKIARIPGVDMVKIKKINEIPFLFDPNAPIQEPDEKNNSLASDKSDTNSKPVSSKSQSTNIETPDSIGIQSESYQPFKEKRNKSGKIIREFSKNINSDELVWHRDQQNRTVRVISGHGWQLQIDNDLPKPLHEGDSFYIPKLEWHRVLPGKTNLIIEIIEK